MNLEKLLAFGEIIDRSLLLAASLLSSERNKRLMLCNIRLDHQSVGWSVRKVYCGKTADLIRMPFGVVSGVGRRTGVLDGLGRPIVTNGAFATRLFSNYFEDLFTVVNAN